MKPTDDGPHERKGRAFTSVATAEIRWLNEAEGGRRTGPPPGPVFLATSKIAEPPDAVDWPSAFSVALRFAEGSGSVTEAQAVEVDFFAYDGARALLSIGDPFEVMEGPRVVAMGTITRVASRASSHENVQLLARLADAAPVDPRSFQFDPFYQPYDWLGELALVVDRRRPEDSRRLLEVVDVALPGASPDLRELLIVGFLEDLQNLILNDGGRLEDWEPVLGPETRRGWFALIEVWQGRMEPDAFNAFVAGGE